LVENSVTQHTHTHTHTHIAVSPEYIFQ